MTATMSSATVETFLAMVRDSILSTADLKPDERERLAHVKVTYGMGNGTYRGITAYGAWKLSETDAETSTDFIEIAATGQESWVQLAGTLLHEFGHSLAEIGHGHDRDWKDACVRLGFQVRPAAAGQRYWLSIFRPELRGHIYAIAALLRDGTPNFWASALAGTGTGNTPRACRAGQGTRGGTSRGTGSGSRLRLWECQCDKPVKVRIASDDFQAHCDKCEQPFERK